MNNRKTFLTNGSEFAVFPEPA